MASQRPSVTPSAWSRVGDGRAATPPMVRRRPASEPGEPGPQRAPRGSPVAPLCAARPAPDGGSGTMAYPAPRWGEFPLALVGLVTDPHQVGRTCRVGFLPPRPRLKVAGRHGRVRWRLGPAGFRLSPRSRTMFSVGPCLLGLCSGTALSPGLLVRCGAMASQSAPASDHRRGRSG